MLYIKALHIIFVVTWFAGLFYIVRLFVYHAEASQKPEPEKSILINHFKGASRRLWYGITWPSAVLTWVFGLWLLNTMFGYQVPDWLWIKICFVIGLTIYHLLCGRIYKQFQRDVINFTGTQLRLWNEVATLFLFTIVFVVVVKDTTKWLTGLTVLVILSVLLFAAIRIYKRVREKNSRGE